jgi:hypothetical protein
MSQNASVTQLTGWQPDNEGVIRIPASLNVPADLIRAVENYGAFLQNLLGQAIAPSAAGAVIYDADLKQIVYGASGVHFNKPTQQVISQRLAQLAQFPAGTLNQAGIPPEACAEPHALNWALFLGCQENNLHVWTFRVNSMRPLQRCANCRHTLPWGNYARIWTC